MYKHLLVPTDGSELSHAGVLEAAQLAANIGARVSLLYVQPAPPKLPRGEAVMVDIYKQDFLRKTAAEANVILSEARAAVEDAGVECDVCTAISDEPWQDIIATARHESCDLIAMASHGRSGIAGLLYGSQAQKVLTHCATPVLVLRPQAAIH
ncbi:universal stress protein [Uliginosibacterium sp. H1]|uniref:universal stress protein n=1 Tax=Uliginosibacterium sp. H1 TaxID=3114757 RepID=UPI002E194AA1|nr:universal stress protein [Uliginosibacterium sp. H1]